ncbi:MAG: hypothetical protein ACE5HD_08730 [Acidobacteriota bacterium]
MRDQKAGQRGEGRVGVLLSLAVLLAAIYSAYVLIPIRIRAYEFLDAMRTEARYGAVNKKDDVVHQRLFKKAKQLGIPLEANKLVIKRDGGLYIITASYSIPVDLTLYRTDWQYNQRATAPIF